MRERLTPHEFHLTQLKHGMERAFTGEYWWTNDVGRYDCISCTQRLFMYDHKFINRSGYPTFWNCLENAVKFVSDNLEVNKVTNAHECPTLKGKAPVKRCVCSNVSQNAYYTAKAFILTCLSFFANISVSHTWAMFLMTVLLLSASDTRLALSRSTLRKSPGSRCLSSAS